MPIQRPETEAEEQARGGGIVERGRVVSFGVATAKAADQWGVRSLERRWLSSWGALMGHHEDV